MYLINLITFDFPSNVQEWRSHRSSTSQTTNNAEVPSDPNPEKREYLFFGVRLFV